MLEKLIAQFLPNLVGDLKEKILGQLEGIAKKYVFDQMSKQMARAIVKGIDAVAKVAVKNLPRTDSEALAAAYAALLKEQLTQLSDAATIYVPLAVDVEIAKKEFGSNSAEAKAARLRREVGMGEIREEVQDVFRAATGGDVKD